jgi:ankyrin repeat protein
MLELEGNRAVDVNADDDAAFRAAVRGNHTRIVEMLLELKGDRAVDVTACGDEAFRMAVNTSNIALVKMLLARGVGTPSSDAVHSKV